MQANASLDVEGMSPQVGTAQGAAAAAEEQHSALPMLAAAAAEEATALAGGAAEGSACADDRAAQGAYASAVFQRFTAKLHGVVRAQHAPGGSSRARHQQPERQSSSLAGQTALTPAAQVSILLREATSLDNLSQMYEGWSAWIYELCLVRVICGCAWGL